MTRQVTRALLRAATLGALATLILVHANGELRRLVNPSIVPRTVFAAGVLGILALAELMRIMPGGAVDAALNNARFGDQGAGTFPEGVPRVSDWWPIAIVLVLLPAAAQLNSVQLATTRTFNAGLGAPRRNESAGWPSAPSTPGLAPEFRGVPGLDPAATEAALELNAPSGAGGAVGTVGAPGSAGTLPAWADIPAEPPLPAWGEGVQELTMESHAEIVEAMYRNPAWFEGRRIALTGFVFREPQWPTDTYAVARMAIWCCAADAVLIGLLAREAPLGAPPADTWVRVTATIGVLDTFEAAGGTLHDVPVLTEIGWEPVQRPAFEYILPAGW